MTEPERRLTDLLQQTGGVEAPEYARLRITGLPRSRSAIAYFELGDPQGTPVLCLHGLSVSGLVFDQYHDHFAEKGIRAIAPCLLGGISLPDPARTITGMAGELLELMDTLSAPRFDVLGFSWGTLPQLALVVRAPERVRSAGFVGPMLPTKFLTAHDIDRLKPDIRASLAMARRVPALHRGLMGLVGLLPASVLRRQFEDEQLSAAECAALAPGGSLHASLERWIDECRRTGSGFYTQGWQMMQGEPGYALSDLASAAAQVDVRLYIGEHDNVHLPVFADRIAAAHCGIDVAAVHRASPPALPSSAGAINGPDVFHRAFSQGRTHILMTPGAGRMACMLYLRQALDDLVCQASSGARARKQRSNLGALQ